MGGPRRRYVAILAIAAGSILAIGSLLRPARNPASGPEPTASELERLAQLAQRRLIEDSARYFASVADLAQSALVSVTTTGLTGIVWTPELVLTASAGPATPRVLAIRAVNTEHEGRTSGGGPQMPLTLIRTGTVRSAPAARGAPDVLAPGSWVLAVWRTGDTRAFAAGHLVGLRSRSPQRAEWRDVMSTIALREEMRGGGIFDLDGRLLGMIVSSDHGLTAIAVGSLEPLIARAQGVDEQLAATLGIRVAPLSPEERAHLRTSEGLLVHDVWDGYAADLAGLAPGDVITAVNGGAVTDASAVAGAVDAARSEPLVLTAVRRGASRQVSIAVDGVPPAPFDAAGSDGVAWESPGRGYRVASVAPDSLAASRGIRAGDWLLRIDGVEPVSLAQVERTLAGGAQAGRYLELRRANRRYGTLF